VDTGGTVRLGRALREAIRTVTDLPIFFVINTHVHPDHVFGNAAFKEDHPVFVGHARLPYAMGMRKPFFLEAQSRLLGAEALGSEMIPPDRTVDTVLELDVGERLLRLVAYPIAHTDADLTVFDVATSTLWVSDLLFMEHIPVVDGKLKGWLNVIEQLRLTKADRAIPGHGPVAAVWPRALDPQQRYLETLLQDVRMAIRQGGTIEQAMSNDSESNGIAVPSFWTNVPSSPSRAKRARQSSTAASVTSTPETVAPCRA